MTEEKIRVYYFSVIGVLIAVCGLIVGVIIGIKVKKVSQKSDTFHGFYYPKTDDTPVTLGRLISEDTITFSPPFETLQQCSDWGLSKQKYGGFFQCAKNCVRLAEPGNGKPFKCDD